MRNKTIYILLILLTSFIEGKGQTLSDYTKIAIENNQQLQSIQHRIEGKGHDIESVGLLSDPMISGGYYVNPVSTRVGDMQAQLTIEQALPWMGTLKAEKGVAQGKKQVEERYYEFEKRKVILSTKQLYYRIKRKQIDKKIYQEQLGIYNKQEEWLAQRVANGQASNVDLLRLRIKIEAKEAKVEETADESMAFQASFNQLLNRNAEETIHVTDQWTELEQFLQDVQAHPSIEIIDSKDQVYQASEKMVRKKQNPQFKVGASYTFIEPYAGSTLPNNGEDALMIKVGISLPFFSNKKGKAQIRSIRSNQSSLVAEKESKEKDLKAAWIGTSKQLQTTHRNIKLFKKQIDLTNQSLELLRSEYLTGKEKYIELLRMEESLLKYKEELSKSQEKAHLLTAMLEFLK